MAVEKRGLDNQQIQTFLSLVENANDIQRDNMIIYLSEYSQNLNKVDKLQKAKNNLIFGRF